MKLADYYEDSANRLINDCIRCGSCVTGCRAVAFSGKDIDPVAVQDEIINFLRGGNELGPAAQFKFKSCMRCYGCLDLRCPIGLNPMLIVELVARKMQLAKENPWSMPLYPVHAALAEKRSSAAEYARISELSPKPESGLVFFPGCNVYKQPDKLLNALDILDAIGKDYSFLPGLAYCCGASARGNSGDAAWLQESAEKLFGLAEELGAKRMVFWCHTCLSVLYNQVKLFYRPPFECLSFSAYVAENLDVLEFPAARPCRVAFHEPCKNAYMGLDLESPRKVLRAIPGTELVEMEHEGRNTLCCGGRATGSMPDLARGLVDARFAEAKAGGAQVLVDLCHNCHEFLFSAARARPEAASGLAVENFAGYVARAMGRGREDCLVL
ncbi:MAG: (Fe-S)-binding protein [Desulfovibrio sp.]|nr:(Fe-S)-binding protein [Desulfovibrio sp.]